MPNRVRREADLWCEKSVRSEEHTSELQSQSNLVCRLLLEKKKIRIHVTQHSEDDSTTFLHAVDTERSSSILTCSRGLVADMTDAERRRCTTCRCALRCRP